MLNTSEKIVIAAPSLDAVAETDQRVHGRERGERQHHHTYGQHVLSSEVARYHAPDLLPTHQIRPTRIVF